MKLQFLLFSLLALLQGCLKCPDDYVAPQKVPSPPVLSVTAVTANEASIAWTKFDANDVRYQIERKKDEGNYALIHCADSDEYILTDCFLTSGTCYTYRINAVSNATHVYCQSNEVSVVTN